MAESKGTQPANVWFQTGDTIQLVHQQVSFTGTAGTSCVVTIVTGKKIPTALTIGHNLSIEWARKSGGNIGGEITVGSVTRNSSNCIAITVNFSQSAGAFIPVYVKLNGTITFS